MVAATGPAEWRFGVFEPAALAGAGLADARGVTTIVGSVANEPSRAAMIRR
jgi:hypothetical protein